MIKSKGMPAAEIADLLAEDESLITDIYNAIRNHPDQGNEKI